MSATLTPCKCLDRIYDKGYEAPFTKRSRFRFSDGVFLPPVWHVTVYKVSDITDSPRPSTATPLKIMFCPFCGERLEEEEG
jgi:hypothetical protein